MLEGKRLRRFEELLDKHFYGLPMTPEEVEEMDRLADEHNRKEVKDEAGGKH